MLPLTPRQAAVFSFLWSYWLENQRPPTVREIGQAFDIASPNGVEGHLAALERKGRILRGDRVARGIKLVVSA